MPGTAARTLACAAELLARFLKLKYDGIAIASRIPRMMMTTSSSIRVKPLSSEARRFRRVLIMCDVLLPEVGGPSGIGCLSESVRPEGVKRRRARFPAPFAERPSSAGLADAGRDRPVRAALEVRDGRRARVLDAVARVVGADDAHVLDACVVGLLELRQGDAGVARGVVGVVGLHARNGGADVGLRGRVVGAAPEAQVRGDRDREQDPEDDDDDEQLDQGEAALVLRDSLPQGADHAVRLLPGWKLVAPARSASRPRRWSLERGNGTRYTSRQAPACNCR